jgi:4-alpha-glucanotransferase
MLAVLVMTRELMHEARRALGVSDLVLAVHDASFPANGECDPGRGSPYGKGAEGILAFADELGFTGLQFGPQGETTRVNRSPYDGTVFAKSVLSIDFERASEDDEWRSVVQGDVGDAAVGEPRTRSADHVVYEEAYDRQRRALSLAWSAFESDADDALRRRFAAFEAANASWLVHDAAFEAEAEEHGTDDARQWPPGERVGLAASPVARRFAFGQFLVHEQHRALRERLARMGWKAWGDMQVGLSPRDRYARDDLFLRGYRMGAPASRTEPHGQAWGYALLDPDSRAADEFFRLRVVKAASEYDGLRVDHPHGIVCPWVYRDDDPEPLHAVAHGARLFESPDLSDLRRFAIARPDQLDQGVARHADGWVRELTDEQVARYGRRIDVVLAALGARGRGPRDLFCEVLSTCPYPLLRVLQRFGLGRLRVTQKADPTKPSDVYRSENAAPEDWIMVGNHDTPPLPAVLDAWERDGRLRAHADYLASLLARPEVRDAFAAKLASDRGAFTEAMTAQLFTSRATHVSVFFADLLGMRARYNVPGVVDDVNWTLRVPRDYRRVHADGLAAGDAMDLRRAFALALRAKSDETRARTDLIAALEAAPRR